MERIHASLQTFPEGGGTGILSRAVPGMRLHGDAGAGIRCSGRASESNGTAEGLSCMRSKSDSGADSDLAPLLTGWMTKLKTR